MNERIDLAQLVRPVWPQATLGEATNEHLEVFTNPAGDRVVFRWVTRGYNNGMFGLPAGGTPVEFSGIAIWRVKGDRLAER